MELEDCLIMTNKPNILSHLFTENGLFLLCSEKGSTLKGEKANFSLKSRLLIRSCFMYRKVNRKSVMSSL